MLSSWQFSQYHFVAARCIIIFIICLDQVFDPLSKAAGTFPGLEKQELRYVDDNHINFT